MISSRVYFSLYRLFVFFFQAEYGIRYVGVTVVQTCALPISGASLLRPACARLRARRRALRHGPVRRLPARRVGPGPLRRSARRHQRVGGPAGVAPGGDGVPPRLRPRRRPRRPRRLVSTLRLKPPPVTRFGLRPALSAFQPPARS